MKILNKAIFYLKVQSILEKIKKIEANNLDIATKQTVNQIKKILNNYNFSLGDIMDISGCVDSAIKVGYFDKFSRILISKKFKELVEF